MDELDRLRTKRDLLQLLAHYAELAVSIRDAWQDRLMAMDGLESSELSKLHGELIAFGWIEQNTGNFPVLRAGAVPACYRVTLSGLRALQDIQAPETVVEIEVIVGGTMPKKVRRKREKRREEELVGAEA